MDREQPTERGRQRPSRRAILVGGLGLAVAGGAAAYELVEAGVLPGRYTLARMDGACGSPPPAPLGAPPSRAEVSFYSAYRGRAVTMVTLSPAGTRSAASLRVLVGLHGVGADARSLASQLSSAMTAAKITGLVTVTVDGGGTYWHKRADGDDPVGMIVNEVLPRLAAAGHDVSRIAIVGESMGGYGALLIAEQLAHGRPGVTAVAALSPAIFASYADAAGADRTAFDSPADFARHDVLSGVTALGTVPTWIGCGIDDPLAAETTRLRARLAAISGTEPAGGISPGCHDDAFWARNLPTALAFLARKTEEGR